MGMSTHIVGFIPPDKKWKTMKKVWDSCVDADIEVPHEVQEFFNWEEPCDRGVEIDLKEHECLSRPDSEYRDIWEINIKKLPHNISHIRFFNSY